MNRFERAEGEAKKQGWTIMATLLVEIKENLEGTEYNSVSLEEIEAVLLALEKVED